MALLQVDTNGRRTLAAQCESLATEVTGTIAATPIGLPWQGTTAAVSAVNVAIGMTVEAMVNRLRSCADNLVTASAGYAVNERDSAAQLGEVTTGL